MSNLRAYFTFILVMMTMNLFIIAEPSQFSQRAEAQGLQLRVSAAEMSEFQNHFFGPQIIQVVIHDPSATDRDQSTVGLQIRGTTEPRVHLQDGLWYSFFAEQASFLVLLDVMTDGVRNSIIVVANPVAAQDANNPTTFTAGGTTYTQTFGNSDSLVSEITVVSGNVFVELDQNDIFPTLPNAFCDKSLLGGASTCPPGNINPNINIPNDLVGENNDPNTNIHTRTTSPFFSVGGNVGDIDWPYIELIGFNELDQVDIRAGSASVTLTYEDFIDSILFKIDRNTSYPLNAELILSYTDLMWNINPVEEDSVIFALDPTTGTPQAVDYNLVRNFNPGSSGLIQTPGTLRNLPNVLPILSRPVLNFDTREVLELDTEGIRTIKFNEFIDVGPDGAVGTIDDTFGSFGSVRIAENARLVSQFAPNQIPVIQMIESDPNTSFFESIDEQAGSRSDIFTGVNDRVATFDYFDIINSAPMTTHDGFASVDKEVYNSADRAVFTVTDADQNLRSRVGEEPSAVRSNSFVKVGAPFPLGNNPTFASFFGKNTLPIFVGANDAQFNGYGSNGVLGPSGAGNDDLTRYGPDGILGTADDIVGVSRRTGIEEAVMTLAIDPDDTNNNGILDTTEGLTAAQRQTNIQNELNTGTAGGAAVSVKGGGALGASVGSLASALDANGAIPAGSVIINTFPAGLGAATATVSHIFQLDLNNNGIIETNGAFAGTANEVIFIAGNGDIRDTAPVRSQKIGLDFSTNGIVPPTPSSPSKSSAIIVNSEVTLADLNKFTEFRATGFQIRANGLSGIPKPTGQAFAVDPSVARTALFTTPLIGTPTAGTVFTHSSATTPGILSLSTANGNNPDPQVFRVLYPEYNLIRADLSEISTSVEVPSGLNFDRVAVQITVDGRDITPSNLVVTKLVDFNGLEQNDVNPTTGSITTQLLDTTKIGTGVFRVVDFLTQDWDSDGTPWPIDADSVTGDQRFFGQLKLQFTIVFLRTTGLTEPVEVIDGASIDPVSGTIIASTNHVAALDIDGLSVVIPPPTLISNAAGSTTIVPAGTEASFPAKRTIDEVTLLASEDVVYRIQTKEAGSNSNVFTGRLDFMTVNQFDTVQKALADIVFSGDPAKALMPNRFIPPNRLAFSYSDIDIVRNFRDVSATFIYETTDGKISWDSKTYKPQARAVLTLEDEDLNRRPDAVERYDLPVAGFIFIELSKKRVDDTCARPDTVCFLSHVDISLRETGPDTGIFQAQIDMPPRLRLANGTVVNTNRDDLEITYIDVRDRSSIRQEFDDVTGVRTKVGTVLLDRNVYPQGPRLPPNTPLLGAIMYIEINKGFFTQDPELRDIFDLTKTVDFSAETAKANDIHDTFEIKIFNGGGSNPVVYSANPSSSIKNGGKAFPLLDRNNNEVTQMLESGPNTNIYELEFMIYCPDSIPELRQLLSAPVCTDTVFNIPSFKANSPIEVTFNDPQDDSGTPEEVDAFAVIQGVTAQLGTDKIEYDVGDPATFFVIEPDFNFDSRAVEQVDFNLIGITTDKTPIDELPLGILINALCTLRSFCTTEPGLRESGNNTGIFGAIVRPGVLDTLVTHRGSKIEVVYNDSTPSGGGSPIRIEYDVFLNANTPEIIFDKEEYTPFDEVIVTIISPDSNGDPFQIDTILPLISTSSDTGFILRMTETGPDSRIFEEDINLTPDKTKFLGDLVAQREDGLTVEFRIDFNTVVTKSVFVNYHVGNVMFDKDIFMIKEKATLRVIDPDENRTPDTIDTIDARVWSTTDRGGLLVTLRETGDRTGVFEEFLTFTTSEESSGTRLRVSEGDTITVKYTDRTLPAPAALDNDGIFTIEVEELFAAALSGSTGPPLERATVKEPKIVNQDGLPIEHIEVDRPVLIQSEITNNQNIKQKFAYIIQVRDSIGVTTSLSWVSGDVPPKDSIIAAQSWIPERVGKYEVEVFVWESMDNPSALSPIMTINITVL